MNMEDCLMLRSILASNLRHGGRQYATRLGRCVDGASDCTQLARLAPPCTLLMRRFMTGQEEALLEDADAHRPPTPDPFEGEGSIWIQVTLRTLSGDVLETTKTSCFEYDTASGQDEPEIEQTSEHKVPMFRIFL